LIEQITTKYKQLEQSIASTHNQLKHKEQEFILIQQKVKNLDKENITLHKELAVSIEEMEGLCNQLKHKEYKFILIQQQLETRKEESSSLQKQLEISRRQTEALHNQVKREKQEAISIQQQIEAYKPEKQILLNQISKPLINNYLLTQNKDFIYLVKDKFKFNEINDKLLHCTGIDKEIFYNLEENLVDYLQAQFELYTSPEKLKQHLTDTYKDISSLKSGRDPEYSLYLTPHIYFMKYFLEGVYSAYLAWFLVYEKLFVNKYEARVYGEME
jgi:chromosome segregation ATPase